MESSTVGAASGSFANKNVGTAKAVAVPGFGLTGADAANYSGGTVALLPVGPDGEVARKGVDGLGSHAVEAHRELELQQRRQAGIEHHVQQHRPGELPLHRVPGPQHHDEVAREGREDVLHESGAEEQHRRGKRHTGAELGAEVQVYRNDEIPLEKVREYDKLILSPGPGIPEEAGLLLPLIKEYAASKSILGVCLGHQAIGEAYGGKLVNLTKVYHGIATPIEIKSENSKAKS